MGKLLTVAGALLGTAVWFLLFVILGIGLGTAFIAGGSILAGGVLAAMMVQPARLGTVLDAPLTAPGVLLGITAFAVLEVVLPVTMWVGVIAGLGVMGVYGIVNAAVRPQRAAAQRDLGASPEQPAARSHSNGHDRSAREGVLAR